jgi:hypothetical protein
MANEIEDLRAQVAKLEALVKTEQGKALAAARGQAAAIREGEKAKQEAQTYREETDQVIANAGDQLKIAWIVGHTIWTFGRWATEQAIEKDTAARILHRESVLVGALADFLTAHEKRDSTGMDSAAREAKKLVSIFKQNSEKLKLDQAQAMLHAASMAARKDVEAAISALRTKIAE